jgi:hypothetical protein
MGVRNIAMDVRGIVTVAGVKSICAIASKPCFTVTMGGSRVRIVMVAGHVITAVVAGFIAAIITASHVMVGDADRGAVPVSMMTVQTWLFHVDWGCRRHSEKENETENEDRGAMTSTAKLEHSHVGISRHFG